MGSRVYDIKKKFEGLCEASQDPTCEIKSNPSKSHLKPMSPHLIFPQKKNIEIVNSNLREAGTKGNIKRSHAFRSDRNNRNPSGSEIVESLNCNKSSNNIVRTSFKSNAGRPITNENQCSSYQESNSVLSNKAFGPSYDCSSKSALNNTSDSFQNIFSNSNIDNHFESNIETIQPQQFNMNEENTTMRTSEKPEYSTVSKHVHPNRPRPSLLELNSMDKSPLHGPTIELLRVDGNKFVQTEVNVMSNRNVKSSIKEKNKNISEDNVISNTLKKVLSSPLPSGPPPKKPPRTFAHTSEWKSTPNSPTSNKLSPTAKVSSSDDLVNLQVERVNLTGPKPIVKPVRSKTESQIMLKKLEIALSNHHQQGRLLESKNEGNNFVNNVFNKPNNRPNSSFLSNKDKSKSNMKHLTVDRKRSLPDSPNLDTNAFSNSGCFGVGLLSCSNSMDLMRSSHIYDVPFESKSHFYVKDKNEGSSGISSVSSKDNNISFNKVSSMQYGRIKSSDKLSEEHVYAKPHIKNQPKTLKSKPETKSVSQLVKMIDSNGKINSLVKSKKEISKNPVLHYMVSIIYYFVLFGLGLLAVLFRILNW